MRACVCVYMSVCGRRVWYREPAYAQSTPWQHQPVMRPNAPPPRPLNFQVLGLLFEMHVFSELGFPADRFVEASTLFVLQ